MVKNILVIYVMEVGKMSSYSHPDSFTKLVDEFVILSDDDPELKDGLSFLDKEAHKRGITFYDMMYEVFLKHDQNKRVKEWMKDK